MAEAVEVGSSSGHKRRHAESQDNSDSDGDFGPAPPPPPGSHDADEKQSDHEDADDDVNFGPARPPAADSERARKRRRIKSTAAYKLQLDRLPSAEMYERSYMHRDYLTHILVTATQFLITCSRDGILKFWKKYLGGIEFVKQYRAHREAIHGVAACREGLRLASSGSDRQIKIFDVRNFDMIHTISLNYTPGAVEWIHDSSRMKARLAVADMDSGLIRVYAEDAVGDSPLQTVDLHASPVNVIKFNHIFNTVISCDQMGMIEYWDNSDYESPGDSASFKFKTDTSLYELAKSRTVAESLSFSSDGQRFVLVGRDLQIRIFNFRTGKMTKKIDESLKSFQDFQTEGPEAHRLDNIDFGRRVAVEKELSRLRQQQQQQPALSQSQGGAPPVPPVTACFDESGSFLIYPTALGIKIVNLDTNQLVRVLGKVENTERFLTLCLFQGVPESAPSDSAVGSNGLVTSAVAKMGAGLIKAGEVSAGAVGMVAEDPCVLGIAYKKERFYWFSRREPPEPNEISSALNRDIFNERPREIQAALVAAQQKPVNNTQAVIHTTKGDIFLTLFPQEAPKTVENFVTLSRRGYYDGLIIHRVIKDFMIQTGDPFGDGTGGESIWGGPFRDEFSALRRHDRPGVLSMANSGPNTNGSQFFITTVECPWLDNKHTVFGLVTKGMDVVRAIESTKVDSMDRPQQDIKIVSVDIE